jgi:hypothetical protein
LVGSTHGKPFRLSQKLEPLLIPWSSKEFYRLTSCGIPNPIWGDEPAYIGTVAKMDGLMIKLFRGNYPKSWLFLSPNLEIETP